MARIKSMNRACKTVVLNPDAGDSRTITVTGWHLEMDESVIYDLYSEPGGYALQWWRCKPFTNFYKGEWSGEIGVPFNWKPDNEDQFFVLLVNGRAISATQGASDAVVTNNGNAVNMVWHAIEGIGEVRITIAAR